MEEKEEAVRLDSLGDDVLYIIASHASFGALISLKSVSDNFSHFARWALKDERWDEARQLCAMPDELHRLSRRDTDAVMDRLAGGFLAQAFPSSLQPGFRNAKHVSDHGLDQLG